VLLLAGAARLWQLGTRHTTHASATTPPARATALDTTPRSLRHSEPFRLLSAAPNVSSGKPVPALTSGASRAALRLSNANLTPSEWTRRETAVLLENARIDTTAAAPAIPEHLRAQGGHGTYIVQARGRIDAAFHAALRQAGASFVSYIPNNAWLVRVSGDAAQNLARQPRVQSVLPYEPYYKLKPDLLRLAVDRAALPLDEPLNVGLFADAREVTVAALKGLGAEIVAEEPSPFGPVVTVRPRTDTLVALAGLPGVQVIEAASERVPANDRGRARMGIAADTVASTNWLGLTGNGVLVSANESGVDAAHPDLAGRMLGGPLTDVNGHGTHVIGTIAGNGAMSATVTSSNIPGSVTPATNGQFRGAAPAARVFVQPVGFLNRPGVSAGAPALSDSALQTTAAQTNAFISNNSWNYAANNGYDLSAARYDAATRDALPGRPGSQPLLFVFATGNAGRGDAGGLGGDPDTLRSPGTAKNVITVGAVEQNRGLTNEVVTCRPVNTGTNTMVICYTNTPFKPETDSDDQVAWFSGRGNMGMGIEGEGGRFKPDVVAPGAWVISTRSAQWNEADYYNPTNYFVDVFPNLIVDGYGFNNYSAFLPPNAVRFWVDLGPNKASPSPFPDLPIYVKQSDLPTTNSYDFIRTNHVAMPPDGGASVPADAPVNYSVANPSSNAVSFDLMTTIATTNDNGNEFEVRRDLNEPLAPYYRYESGSSMAAAHVSGTLALMQEFFERRLARHPSPALMKALLINGARSLGVPYDFQTEPSRNYQGWGLVNLPTTLPQLLTNLNTQTSGPVLLFDQNPAKALATGERHVRRLHLADAARAVPLRITLVWTDPPGNPAAGVKLVNDLDLVVTNLDTGEVYSGNDIPAGSEFTQATPTNSAPNPDVVNNVENVYIPELLGTNYAITVIGSRVNVNAVTGDPDNTAQDYALVITSGDGDLEDALTITEQPVVSVNVPNVTESTNVFNSATTPGYTGTLLLGQHVGANTPLLGVTNGILSQWHFYVLTNTESYTNAAFITFQPTTLSIPRLGVNEDNVSNATREEADIDLYVSTDPGLLNLDPNVIAQCAANVSSTYSSSRSRGGTEVVVYSNAVPGGVYYIGVKAEDQMAAEYGFLGVFSLLPFSEDDNGNPVLRGFPAPMTIKEGSPSAPGAGYMFAVGIKPMSVRRVIVTNIVTHENFGDLVGSLDHNGKFAVLNNHTLPPGFFPPPLTYLSIYEDNDEGNVFGSRNTDGPGSLRNFVGEQGVGLWLFQEVNDALTQTGRLETLFIRLEPQNLDAANATPRTVQPFSWTYDFIDVPSTASKLTVCVDTTNAPMELYIRRGGFPSRTEYDYTLKVTLPGGCLSISRADLPPLTAGRYYIGVFNPNPVAQTIRLTARLEYDLEAIVPMTYTDGNAIPIQDDAVTYATQFVTNQARVASLEVGLRVDHPRASDLAFTLVSPQGTRVLLMEDRGWTNSANIGGSLYVTNSTNISDVFETASAGNYAVGTALGDWTVTNNPVTVISNAALAHSGQHFVSLRSGAIQRTFPTTNGGHYTLTFVARNDGIVSWWPADDNAADVVDGNPGTLVNQAAYTNGQVGRSFLFDGNNDGVWVGTNSNLQLQDFTVEAWVMRSDASRVSRDTTADGAIFSVGGDGSGFAFELRGSTAFTNDIGQLVLAQSQLPSRRLVSSARVADATKWRHVAVTRQGPRVVFYLDGVAYPHPTLATNLNFTFTAPAFIGAWWNPALPGIFNPDHGFWGQIDELAVYNRELTGAEIQAIYQAGAAGKCGVLATPAANCPALAAQVLASGIATNTFTAPSTNWTTNTLTFTATQTNTLIEFRAAGGYSGILLDTVSLTETEVTARNFYLTFTEDTNVTATPIKFATPPFQPSFIPPTFFTSEFETAAPGEYLTGATVEGWTVETNQVSVFNDPAVAALGTNALALGVGRISEVLPTLTGHKYTLHVGYRGPGIVSWWRGENDTLDSAGGHAGTPPWFDYTAGEVGQSFDFSQRTQRIRVADNPAFQLAHSLTIEGWIQVLGDDGVILFRGDDRPGLDPYFLGMGPPGFLQFHVESQSASENLYAPIGFNQWKHVVATLEGSSGRMRLYVDGRVLAQTITAVRPLGSLNPAFSPAIGLGNSGGSLFPFFPFQGLVDELSLYSRALTPTEIKAIYGAGSAGKFDPDPLVTAPQSLAEGRVTLSGVATNLVLGDNATWHTNSTTFTATTNGTPLSIEGLEPGLLLDSIALTEELQGLTYLPEESLNAFQDENAFGTWTLEMLDTRVGATNPAPQLVSWQLRFVFQNDIAIPRALQHGEPATNTVPAGLIAYYLVDVPAWAQFATNTLLFASAPLNLWFNQDAPPFGTNVGDYLLLGAATGGSATLSRTTVPPLQPGRRYYLGVQNTNAAPVPYGVQVDFDITPLTTGVPISSTLASGAAPRYFSHDVATNATAMSYRLFNLSGDVNLVARRGVPLPDLTSYDYASFNSGVNDEEILIFTNSVPVALSPGRWYLGVFNADIGSVNYTILATELTNQFPNIITLTNAVPFCTANTNGVGSIDYYRFAVSPGAVRAQFEIDGPTADMTLVARKGLPLPTLSLFDYLSANPGTNDELIVVYDFSSPVPLSPGDWFIAAVPLVPGPVSYCIMALEWGSYGTNLMTTNFAVLNNTFCLTWQSLPGVHYVVEGVAEITSPNWATLSSTITATDYSSTWCVALPSPYHFFRVREGLAINQLAPPLAISSITRTNNGILLRWDGPVNTRYGVQWSPPLAPLAWTSFTNVITSATAQFSFLDDGSQTGGLRGTRLYRLVQLP